SSMNRIVSIVLVILAEATLPRKWPIALKLARSSESNPGMEIIIIKTDSCTSRRRGTCLVVSPVVRRGADRGLDRWADPRRRRGALSVPGGPVTLLDPASALLDLADLYPAYTEARCR